MEDVAKTYESTSIGVRVQDEVIRKATVVHEGRDKIKVTTMMQDPQKGKDKWVGQVSPHGCFFQEVLINTVSIGANFEESYKLTLCRRSCPDLKRFKATFPSLGWMPIKRSANPPLVSTGVVCSRMMSPSKKIALSDLDEVLLAIRAQ